MLKFVHPELGMTAVENVKCSFLVYFLLSASWSLIFVWLQLQGWCTVSVKSKTCYMNHLKKISVNFLWILSVLNYFPMTEVLSWEEKKAIDSSSGHFKISCGEFNASFAIFGRLLLGLIIREQWSKDPVTNSAKKSGFPSCGLGTIVV